MHILLESRVHQGGEKPITLNRGGGFRTGPFLFLEFFWGKLYYLKAFEQTASQYQASSWTNFGLKKLHTDNTKMADPLLA